MEMDPDPTTVAETRELMGQGDADLLEQRFGSRLEFGTAGLRGRLGAGPMRMNRLVAMQTAAGVARRIRMQGDELAARCVVVAHDARFSSNAFAADIVDALAGAGICVHVIDGPAPTPLAVFAIRLVSAAAALVVTASHNPRQDNGIKVYWADGAQIAPPLDEEIAAQIETVDASGQILPRPTPTRARVQHLGAANADSWLVDSYIHSASDLVEGPPTDPLPIAATSLHGVGATLLTRVLTAYGHGPLHHVPTQRDPDPRFPSVEFPNPEEDGALDLLIDLAESRGAALAIANDPDADRLALAVPGTDGSWRTLTGDETGALLAWRQLALTEGIPDRLLVTTFVSSRLLGSMAAAADAHYEETATGFKWLCRPAMENPSWRQVMAYEEALGYAIGPRCRDKDGITAALVAADTICALAAERRTVWDVLDELARTHGAHVTHNGSIRTERAAPSSGSVGSLESLLRTPPESLGGFAVGRVDRPAPMTLKLLLEDDTRVVLRPSGTEPKVKFYCEAIEHVDPKEDPDSARARARARLRGVLGELEPLLG
jgi:phosphomannomutase